MSIHLSPSDIKTIVSKILAFDGEPSWNDIINIAEKVTGQLYSRVTLSTKADIKLAYDQKTKGGEDSTPRKGERPKSLVLRKAEERIQNLERKLAHSLAVNTQLTEQFIVWAYNAHQRGMSEADLSRPLPVINRHSNVKPNDRK